MNGDASAKVQRVRIRFARDGEASDFGALDVTHGWEQALLAANIPLSYSAGRKRQPRITVMSAGLAQGTTSDGELLDLFLHERMPPADVLARISDHLPAGLRALDAREIGVNLPSLPSVTRWAEYDVTVRQVKNQATVFSAIERFLAAEAVPWEDTRGEKVRQYDLRGLVDDVRASFCSDAVRVSMRLRCDSGGVGRPEQVVKALGLPEPARVHRTRIILDDPSPARDAWRRRGRFA